MSILDRIRANGGEVVRDEWRFSLRRGRLDAAALEWLRANWRDVCRESWAGFDAWDERAGIREYDGGQARADAEAGAYLDVIKC